MRGDADKNQAGTTRSILELIKRPLVNTWKESYNSVHLPNLLGSHQLANRKLSRRALAMLLLCVLSTLFSACEICGLTFSRGNEGSSGYPLLLTVPIKNVCKISLTSNGSCKEGLQDIPYL
ncbi:hypothetical protein CDAR_586361 [Caerostris darwini]|uniref:Uncharacterized protein n=1 Tax=Caerostris darwini TaxID=1538125 RepID=A0AAV4Q9B7_9ARAC|nr:hypothetical protein CDAR_586361 [Caerostris darwini]